MSQQPHEPEYQINTSALRRAFPDFSQHGSSDEESIEVGRGLPPKTTSAQVLPSEDPTENVSLNLRNGERYTVTGTPPLKPKNTQTTRRPVANQTNMSKAALSFRNSSQKENYDPTVKTTSYGSPASSEPNMQRKSSVLPTVETEDSASVFTRPKSHYASARSTRFTSPVARQPLTETQNTQNVQAAQVTANDTYDSVISPANGTYQSFLLPDMPNMTELMTGQKRDGTPYTSRGAKARSRQATPSSLRKRQNAKSAHNEIGDVSIPADAKALHLSLQLLHEKVRNLERERDQAVEKADNYEFELLQLRSKVEAQDTANTTLEGEGDERTKDWDTERTKFEKSVRTLQGRLKHANKKLSASESTIKTLTNDRDIAQQQLSEAYFNSEELKTESQAVRDQISTVKAQLSRVTKQHEKRIEILVAQEGELRGKIERREKAVHEMASLAKDLWRTRNALARSSSVHGAAKSKTQAEHEQQPVETKTVKSRQTSGASRQSRPKSIDMGMSQRTHPRRSNLDDSLTVEPSSRHVSSGTAQTQIHHAVPAQQTEDLAYQDFSHQLQSLSVADLERCETYLSFMEGDEVAKLRAVLQQDKARLASSGVQSLDFSDLRSAKPNPPRKSSLRDLGKPSSKQVQYEDDEEVCQEITGDLTGPIRRPSGHGQSANVRDDDPLSAQLDFTAGVDRDLTRQSVQSTRSEQRHRKGSAPETDVHDENMTSAYILPDITMTGADLAQSVQPKTTADVAPKEKTTIVHPVPVSERPVSPTPSNPDPTLRPSREPAVALTLVIRSLEAEVDRLRARLAAYEKLYAQTEPALSKRRRKAIWARIVKTGESIERRCDQVYGLYDVLEGFKGGVKDEGDVEVTLGELGLGFGVGERSDDGSEGESNGEEEFDGFETTGTQRMDVM